MSTVKVLREEFQSWSSWWRQIEAFLERIDEARETDAEGRRKFEALIDVVTAIEDEKRIRNGSGLGAPLEIALKRKEPGASRVELMGDPPPSFKRVPGVYDLEIAVAPMNIPKEAIEDTEFDWDTLDVVRFAPNHPPLFQRYDSDKKQWASVRSPAYDFGNFDIVESITLFPYCKDALFDPNARRLRSLLPKLPPPFEFPSFGPTWASCKSGRTPPTDAPHLFGAVFPDAYPDDIPPGGIDVFGIAKKAEALCTNGAAALDRAAQTLKDDEFLELDDKAAASFTARIKKAAGEFKVRAKLYSDFSKGVKPANVATVMILQELGTSLKSDIEKVLNDAVEQRIVDPDGTLRTLRALEWAFNGFWYARLSWFVSRKKRRLDPLLIRRFLGTFLSSFAAAYGGHPTGLPFKAALAKPAFILGEHLQVPPGVKGLDKLKPGMIAVIDGERRTIAVVLGEDPGPGGIPRIRVLPLQISMAVGTKVPGIAGMVTGATISAGPVPTSLLTAKNLRDGAVQAHPEHDGLAHELAAHWSRLCLLLGWKKVNEHLKEARPDLKNGFPTHLPRTLQLPVIGPIPPGGNRIILDTAALRAKGFDLDGPKKPVIARPGEVLLLRGKDKGGGIWQGAVEVMTIGRTTADKVNDEAPSPPPGKPICCQDPGDRVIVQVKGTSFPVPLVSAISIHADFQGFGAPSLAVGTLLPKEIDPASHTGDKTVYRGPELTAARAILTRWMWTR